MENRLKALRIKEGLTQGKLAKIFNIKQNSLSNYELGNRQIPDELKVKIGKHFNVSIDYLLGHIESNASLVGLNDNTIEIPVYGKIPAGTPFEMIEDIVEKIKIPASWVKNGVQYFGLKIDGNSMLPEFRNGDTIILRQQPNCESGQYCAVSINSTDAVFKKVIKKPNGILLQPLNTEYEPVFYTKKEIEELPVTILGVLVENRRSY